MAKTKRRFWGPALATIAVWVGALAWLGLPGLLVAFVAHCVGGVGTVYNMIKSGEYVRADG